MNDVKPRILCVDDDADVLDGFKQNLRKRFNLHLATDAAHALEKLREFEYEVIMSDMRMPGMNGSEFLHKSRSFAPDATRLLLTGQCDIASAVSAVNDGQIFRFLTKPCASKDLQEVLDAAVHQHRLVVAEKELLHKTLKGSIKVLVDALAMTSPLAFGCAKRLHKRAVIVAKHMQLKDRWSIEIAAMLSQLGAISLTDELLGKVYSGAELNPKEQKDLESTADITLMLLSNIPRLEKVQNLLTEVFLEKEKPKLDMTDSAQVLCMALDIDAMEIKGSDIALAISTIASRENTYKKLIIDTYDKCFNVKGKREKIKEIATEGIQEGMIVAENIYTSTGALLVTRGFEITAGFAEKTKHFTKGFLKEPLRVIVPEVENAIQS